MGLLGKGKKYEDKKLEFSKDVTNNEQPADRHESVMPVKQPLDMKIEAAKRRVFAQVVRKRTTESNDESGAAAPDEGRERER